MNTKLIIGSIAGLLVGAAISYFATRNSVKPIDISSLFTNNELQLTQSSKPAYYSIDAQTSLIEDNNYLAVTNPAFKIIINEDTIVSSFKPVTPGEAKIYTQIDLEPGEYIEKQDTNSRVIVERGIADENKEFSEADVLKTYTPASDYRILSPDRTEFCVQDKSINTNVMDCYSTTIQRLCILHTANKLVVIKRPFKECIN